MKILYRGSPVINTDTYVYLGNTLDRTLTLQKNFDVKYKKISKRLRLFAKIRSHLNVKAAKNVYTMMIRPIFVYGSIIQLDLTDTQKSMLDSLHDRAKQIIGETIQTRSFHNIMMIKICTLVKKCMDANACIDFHGYFNRVSHYSNTRNNSYMMVLPKCKLEFGKKSFRFQGAKMFNSLPLKIRKEISLANFKRLMKEHFSTT